MAISLTEVGPAVPQFWLRAAIGYLRANLGVARMVRRDADTTIAELGDTVNITKRGSLTVRDKAEDTDITTDSPANTNVSVVLNQHKYVSWTLESNAESKAIDDALAYVADGAAQLAEAVDTSLLALHPSIANDVGTAGTDINAATILGARQQLNVQKAPMAGRRMVISPKDEVALLDTARFVEADKVGDSGDVLREGMLGRLYGMDVFMSQLVDVTTGSPNTTHNIAFNEGAFMLVTRTLAMPDPRTGVYAEVLTDPELGISMRYIRQWNTKALATEHVIDLLYGVSAVDEDRLAVEVLS